MGVWNTLRALWARPGVRIGLSLLILVVAVVALGHNTDLLEQGWAELRRANPWWLVVAVVFIGVTMCCQAEVMVVLLRGAGVAITHRGAIILGLAANAWSSSLPGGPAVSAAMIFREQKYWGAGKVVAGWYMLVSGILAAAGMAILGVIGVFFLGAYINPWSLVTSLVTVALALGAINWIGQHLEVLERPLMALARRLRQDEARARSLLIRVGAQLQVVRLHPARLLGATCWAVGKWVAEICCLWACALAVGSQPSLAGITLSFLVAKLVGQAQITPGGLGPVDVALTSALVPLAGISGAQAIACAIIFRLISFIGLAAVGWLVFLWRWTIRGVGSTGSAMR